jgi:Leucine-rich repeat (LRR) protein
MLSDQEFNALHDLYNSTNGDGWRWWNMSSTVPWNFSAPNANPCADKWQGLGCSCTFILCEIIHINLTHHNMSGQLPLTVGSFPSMQSLSFHFNNISGTLPTTIGNLTKLERLDLSTNSFVGEIPSRIASLQNLQSLDLSRNGFTKLPEEFFTLTKLQDLFLAANSLSGPISPSFGKFHDLVILQLEGNHFSQTLPDIFESFPSLQTLNIENNNITGALPPSFYKMYNLSSLFISFTKITSTLSSAFGNLTNLQTLHLSESYFYGTLPESFSKLTKLIDCEIANNLFSGPVPLSLLALRSMDLLYLQSNSFTGDVSFLTELPTLHALDLYNNFFNGTFPVKPYQLLHLQYLQISYNSFCGPMPWNEKWHGITNYEITANYFSGVLPHGNTTVIEMKHYHDCAHLVYLVADQNYLTGTIPEYFYLNCPWANYIIFSENYFTGTVSQNIRSLTRLNEWNVSLNYLTGSIPAEIGSLTNIAVMDFSNNQFSAKVPSIVQTLHVLEEFFIQNNQLTGSLNDFLGVGRNDITILDLSGNKFTGTLPSDFFVSATNLQSFVATDNCLSGSIPEAVCSSSTLISLSLDGLSTAENCRIPLFSAISPLFDAFTTRHFLRGTIPPCLYVMPSLQLLHLSGNGITGTIPSSISFMNNLTDLSLSHNLLTGTIPMNIQTKYWENLDLSYNKLSGTLSSEFVGVFDPSGNQDLYLEVNRLSGNIPSSFQNITNLAVLYGNIFSCNFNGNNLPKHDSHYTDYSCGSDSVNYALFGWVWAFLPFPVIFLILFKYLAKNFSLISNKEDDIETTGTDNSITDRSPAEKPPTRSTGFQYLIEVYRLVQVWKQELRRDTSENCLNLLRLSFFLVQLRQSVFLVTVYCVCILLPLYCVLKKFNASFSVEYAWYVGGVLLSGEIAAVLLFLALLGFLLLIYYLLGERLGKTINTNAPKSPDSESNIFLSSSASSMQFHLSDIINNDSINIRKTVAAMGVKETRKDSLIMTLNYSVVFIINLLIMGIVDFSYVYIVISYTDMIVTMAAFSLALFRLITNNLLLSKAIPMAISGLTYLIPAWKELYFYQQKYPGSVKNVFSYYTYRDISFLDNLILFNSIILPVLATIFILPDCFYNALFAAPDVSSYYTFDQCDRINVKLDLDWLCSSQTQTLSYSPPYIYSYQCSSKVVINYASVYILMFILAGFIPLMKLGLKLYYDNVIMKNIVSTARPSRRQLRIKSRLELFLPNYYFPIRDTRGQERTTMEKKMYTPKSFVLFSKLRLTVKINSYLTILATFGALFPPLAIVGCLTIFIITYFEELSIGWLLAETRAKKYFWYEEQLNHEAENVEKSSNFTLFQDPLYRLPIPIIYRPSNPPHCWSRCKKSFCENR